MSGQSTSRKKHLGFKMLGADPAHDAVYAVLEALPRGAASDFIVKAVMEYLANHSGETIGGRKVYILPAVGGEYKDTLNKEITKKTRRTGETTQTTETVAGVAAHADGAAASDIHKVEVPEEEAQKPKIHEKPLESQTKAPSDNNPYSDLDNDFLTQLVLGFGNSQ